MNFNFYADTPEELKETRKRINKLKEELIPLLEQEKSFLNKWVENNVLVPSYYSGFNRSFTVSELSNEQRIVLNFHIDLPSDNLPTTKIAKLIRAGLNINTVLSSGIFTREQKKELLDEILEEK